MPKYERILSLCIFLLITLMAVTEAAPATLTTPTAPATSANLAKPGLQAMSPPLATLRFFVLQEFRKDGKVTPYVNYDFQISALDQQRDRQAACGADYTHIRSWKDRKDVWVSLSLSLLLLFHFVVDLLVLPACVPCIPRPVKADCHDRRPAKTSASIRRDRRFTVIA